MHILPVAGSATRFGGIPKYLLPINLKGESLLQVHIRAALQINLGKIVVMAHPTMYEYLVDYLSNIDSRIVIAKINSKTMTETLIEAGSRFGSQGEIISISLPDTITKNNIGKEYWEYIEESRIKTNCLILYPARESQRGKFGQVQVSEIDGKVEEIRDKDELCEHPYIWGGISISRDLLLEFESSEPTIGNCINQYITKGGDFQSLVTNDRYFDCGNMADYLEFLGTLKIDSL